jgi:hypothetical protein
VLVTTGSAMSGWQKMSHFSRRKKWSSTSMMGRPSVVRWVAIAELSASSVAKKTLEAARCSRRQRKAKADVLSTRLLRES